MLNKVVVCSFFLLIINSCVVWPNQRVPRMSHVGVYSEILKAHSDSNNLFNATLEFVGYEEKSLEDGNNLPQVVVCFYNYSTKNIIIDFPFNWMRAFVKEPVFFNFDHFAPPNKRMEYFYYTKIDSLNQSIRNPVQIILPKNQSLKIKANVFARQLLSLDDMQGVEFLEPKSGPFELSLHFNYFVEMEGAKQKNHFSTIPVVGRFRSYSKDSI
tara:strand:+ start:687 stop:1325 length:639 start_codon:yes stop_codon:yes gene_type:complete